MFLSRIMSSNEYLKRRVLLQRYHSVEEVPESHREPGIINGYRHFESTAFQAIVSLFNATNETLNFWTHFIPTLYFLWQFCNLSSTMPLFSDTYMFPFVCYMATSCCYPLMSCIAHAFSCLSTRAAHLCFFLDYAALSLYSWGVAVMYYSYCLPNDFIKSSFSSVFLPVASVNAVVATIMACYSRFCKNLTIRKLLRLGAFIIPYIWDSIPLVWRLITCDPNEDTCADSKMNHYRQFLSVVMASFFYASHIPERLAPGKFDIVGHSHNLLHLFGIIATNEQLTGALIDLEGRKEFFQSSGWTTNPIWATTVTTSIVAANIAIILGFACAVRNIHCNKDQPISKETSEKIQ